MDKQKEFVVSIKVTEQVSPDDFAVFTKTLKVTPETTIGEIETWYRKYFSTGYAHYEVNELEYVIAPKLPAPEDDLPY